MKPNKVLVTGAGGLIGSAICSELSLQGVNFRAFLKDDEPDTNIRKINSIEIYRGDIRDMQTVSKLMDGCDSCIHSAALNKMWHKPTGDYYDINLKGTANVCKAALDRNLQRIVYTSSCGVMGPATEGSPKNEDAPLILNNVKGNYERSKFLAEDIVKIFMKRGLPANIIRPTAVIGPGDIHATPPGQLIRKFLLRGMRIYYDASINVVDSRDIAKAHIAALRSKRSGETYIVGAHNISLKRLFELLSQESGIPAPSLSVGYTTAFVSTMILHTISLITNKDPGITMEGIKIIKHPWFFDSTKAMKELNFHPRPLEETVRDVISWYLKREKI